MRLATDPLYCPVVGWYTPQPTRLPRPRIHRYHHRCPDGTLVLASAQHLPVLHRTLYRFTIAGRQVGQHAVDGYGTTPDWTVFDADHALVMTDG